MSPRDHANTRPLTRRLVVAAAPRARETVLDIGCGVGALSAQIKRKVGARGLVIGIDRSELLVATAKKRVRGAVFHCADAATYSFAPVVFDLIASDFGLTFFADPVAAFAHLRGSLEPGGRLAFTCYGRTNAWLTTVIAAARAVAPGWDPPALDGPGPFAFRDRAVIARVLAGFTKVKIVSAPLSEWLATDREHAAVMALARPIVARLLADLDDAARIRVLERVERALGKYRVRGGYAFPATAWLVTASAPRTAPASPSPGPSRTRPRRRRP